MKNYLFKIFLELSQSGAFDSQIYDVVSNTVSKHLLTLHIRFIILQKKVWGKKKRSVSREAPQNFWLRKSLIKTCRYSLIFSKFGQKASICLIFFSHFFCKIIHIMCGASESFDTVIVFQLNSPGSKTSDQYCDPRVTQKM